VTVDVELADPELASLDNAIALLGLALAGYGAYRVFTRVGTEAGLVGWVLLAGGWLLVFPRVFLGLSLTHDAVEVDVMSGTRSVDLADVQGARLVDGWLVIRLGGVGAARYHTGRFYLPGEGHVRAYASRIRGPFVLLDLGEDRDVVVSPADPEGFRDEVRRRATSA
jgi:hypothetical protein